MKPSSICKSASQAVHSRMHLTLHAVRRTPHGASRMVLSVYAWSVRARRAPSRHCRDARVYKVIRLLRPCMHGMSTAKSVAFVRYGGWCAIGFGTGGANKVKTFYFRNKALSLSLFLSSLDQRSSRKNLVRLVFWQPCFFLYFGKTIAPLPDFSVLYPPPPPPVNGKTSKASSK